MNNSGVKRSSQVENNPWVVNDICRTVDEKKRSKSSKMYIKINRAHLFAASSLRGIPVVAAVPECMSSKGHDVSALSSARGKLAAHCLGRI